MIRIVEARVEPLVVPLRDSFVIASARIDATRAALVDVVVVDEVSGRIGRGLGEAASLPPLTPVDQPEVLCLLQKKLPTLAGQRFCGHGGLADMVDALALDLVSRSAVESALLFAWADVLGVPMHRLLGSEPDDDQRRGFSFETDITIPLGPPVSMASLAASWVARGFRILKVKVGRPEEMGGAAADVEALRLLAERCPHVRLRLDGNAGQDAERAAALFHHALRLGLAVELLEQPTPVQDLQALVSLSLRLPIPVVADESATDLRTIAALANAGVKGVNLKLVKYGGPLATARIGRYARRQRLFLMAGAMVETRVGLSAMAHVVRALTPASAAPLSVDLDTAFLLTSDPFVGGYEAAGPRICLTAEGPCRR